MGGDHGYRYGLLGMVMDALRLGTLGWAAVTVICTLLITSCNGTGGLTPCRQLVVSCPDYGYIVCHRAKYLRWSVAGCWTYYDCETGETRKLEDVATGCEVGLQ